MNSFKPLIVLALSLSSPAASALETLTHVAGDAGFRVSSHLVMGQREALLVDAQFTNSEARALIEKIRASGRELTQIFVTHAHPDHYFGLEAIRAAFPRARVLARPSTIAEITATGPGKLAYWRGAYGAAEMPSTLVIPEPVTASALVLEGEALALVDLAAGESETAAALIVPSASALIAGDLAYHGVHLWLAEGRPEGWLANLAAIEATARALGLARILPGHGEAQGLEALGENRAYIEAFLAESARSRSADELQSRMLSLHPDHALPIILTIAAQAAIPAPRP